MEEESNNQWIYPTQITVTDVSGHAFPEDIIASPNYVIGICHSGTFKGDYDYEHVEFTAGDLALIYPNHVLVPTEVSEDYSATIINVPSEVFYSMIKHFVGVDQVSQETEPCFHLNESQHEGLMHLVDALRTVQTLISPSHREMEQAMLEIIIEAIHHYHSQLFSQRSAAVSGLLSKRFFQTLIEHCAEHHEVSFYANIFCLSPKYFSSVVRRETGYNALYWIQFYLAAKAKQLLYMQSDMPLQQMADKLGFADQAAFSRFFKRVVGMSPSQWRHRITCANAAARPTAQLLGQEIDK